MNSDQVKGAVEKVGGKIKEGVGELTGNPQTQAEGKIDEVKGQARESVGDVKEGLKDSE